MLLSLLVQYASLALTTMPYGLLCCAASCTMAPPSIGILLTVPSPLFTQ
jgi:hypothetical protein